jgi:hypothetical protein
MKYFWGITLLVMLLTGIVAAQDSTATPTPTATATIPAPLTTEEAEITEAPDEPFTSTATVIVISAFVRAEPSEEAEMVASVFEDDLLEVIGRNVDGTWFEVRRPGRIFSLGWIFAELIGWDFKSERLPLTNAEVLPLEGEIPDSAAAPVVVEDTGFAVFVLLEANLRDEPFASGEILAVIPHSTTVPVIGRDSEGTWLFVNYRGVEGWISNINFRRPENIDAIPVYIIEGIPIISAPIIPIEIQLGQLEAFRTYVLDSRATAINLRDFWWNVTQGEVMPCEAPPFVTEYLYTPRDVQQLPELDRYAPRFNEGIDLLNNAIDPLTTCGVLRRDVATTARNAAINAAVIFDATLGQLDNLESIITRSD